MSENDNPDLLKPQNMVRMNEPDGSAFVKGICGDSMEMYIVVEDNVITEATFFTDGCISSRACGSTAARMAKGKTIKEALRISPADILDSWGDIPGGNVHCTILAVSTLHKAIAEYLIRTQNS